MKTSSGTDDNDGNAPDWTDAVQDPSWYVVIGTKGGSDPGDAETAFTWLAPAPDEASAKAMALADAHRAFAIQAAMRGASAALPAAIADVRSCERDDNGDAPFFRVGKAMRIALATLGRPNARWGDDAIYATAKSALRCVAGRAALREGHGICALYGDGDGPPGSTSMKFTIVACHVEVTPDGRDIGEPDYDLPLPGALRATLLALAIAIAALAAETGEDGSGVAAIAVPASATLRAAMRADLASTRAVDAARVARFLEEAGLGPDAAEFLAAFGA